MQRLRGAGACPAPWWPVVSLLGLATVAAALQKDSAIPSIRAAAFDTGRDLWQNLPVKAEERRRACPWNRILQSSSGAMRR